jgi:hypothetical protein
MAQAIALMASAALGLFSASSHEPFHADGGQEFMAVTERSRQTPPQRRRDLPCSDRTVDQDSRSGRCTAESGRTWNQGGAATRRRWPGVSAGLSLARPRPAHAGPHTRGGARSKLLMRHAGGEEGSRFPRFPLSSSQLPPQAAQRAPPSANVYGIGVQGSTPLVGLLAGMETLRARWPQHPRGVSSQHPGLGATSGPLTVEFGSPCLAAWPEGTRNVPWI